MKNLFRTIISIIGFAIGPGVVMAVYAIINSYFHIDLNKELLGFVNISIYIVSAIISGIIFIVFSGKMADSFIKLTDDIENNVDKVPARTVYMGIAGLSAGIITAFSIAWLLDKIPIRWLTIPVSIIIFIMLGYIGLRIGVKCSQKYGRNKEKALVSQKLLDTSVIIDGRIFDILKTGIIEGEIIIPEFVLSELRHIADSQDGLTRTKGRRGLDILKKIQTELEIPVIISEEDFEDISEVDAKLLRLALQNEATVITNDFNLNKVASVQGVRVFNINELANAVKPVLLPGEELVVTVVKEGKETGQGVAFLDDGTMIVVENGKDRIGDTVEAVVTSALQTAAGRMIFAKIKD